MLILIDLIDTIDPTDPNWPYLTTFYVVLNKVWKQQNGVARNSMQLQEISSICKKLQMILILFTINTFNYTLKSL